VNPDTKRPLVTDNPATASSQPVAYPNPAPQKTN
jgi:hypothetical protein